MVLLLQSFHKLCSRHSHKPSSSSVSHLRSFISKISSSLNQIPPISDSKPLSLQWILHLLQAIPILQQAFAKLAADLDHPVGKWGGDLVDGYLNYSLNLLDLLNSVTFSLTQLAQSRISLACASNSTALKPIVLVRNYRGFENRGVLGLGGRKQGCSGEERAIWEALAVMEGIGYWICGILISGCEGDSAAYFEMRDLAAGVAVPALAAVDSAVSAAVSGKGSVPVEVEEVNVAVAEVVDGGGGEEAAAAEMKRRLVRLEMVVERLGKEVDGIFSKVLDGRSQLLDVFRHHKTLN